MLGAVARLLLSEKPKCNVVIGKNQGVVIVHVSIYYETVADALNVHKNNFEFNIGNYLMATITSSEDWAEFASLPNV